MNNNSSILLGSLIIALLVFHTGFLSHRIYAVDMGGGDMGGGDMGGGDMGGGDMGGGDQDHDNDDDSDGSKDDDDGDRDDGDSKGSSPPPLANIEPSDNLASILCTVDFSSISNEPHIVSIQHVQKPQQCPSGSQQQGTVFKTPQGDWWAGTGASAGSTAGTVIGTPGGPLTMTGGALVGGFIGVAGGKIADWWYAKPTQGSTVFKTPQGDWWASTGATIGSAGGAALLSGASSLMWPVAGALAGAVMLGGFFGDLADRYNSPPIPPTGPATEVRQQQPPVSVFGAPPDSIPGSAKFRAK